MPTIADRVQTLIAGELGVDEERVIPTADLRHDLEADSLDMIEIVMALEQEFDVEISDDRIDATNTVADVVQMVRLLLLPADF